MESIVVDERQVLSYAEPARRSRIAGAFRLIGAATCVVTTLVGLGIIGWASLVFRELLVAPSPNLDRSLYVTSGTVGGLIGLLITGCSVRWLINAIRPKRAA